MNKVKFRDEDPEFFSTDPDPDPAQLKKNSGYKYIYLSGNKPQFPLGYWDSLNSTSH